MRTRHIGSSSDLVPSNKPVSKESGRHQTVLLHEAIEELSIKPTDTVVDATLGGAGHARAITDLLDEKGTFIGFDLDEDAIVRAQVALAEVKPRTFLIESNFRNIERELGERGIIKIDRALYDLGWSAYQLSAGRGFSFLKDEPLLMTYGKGDEKGGLTAATIVNEWGEESIADIIFGWGEDGIHAASRTSSWSGGKFCPSPKRLILRKRSSRRCRRHIGTADCIRDQDVSSTTNCRERRTRCLEGKLGWRMEIALAGRTHRSHYVPQHRRPDRQRVISEFERSGGGTRITRSPKKPSREEIVSNPRSRSAKLRVIEKN